MSDANAHAPPASMSEAVARFVSVTGADAQQAQFCIEACGGNVERALQMFYGSDDMGMGPPAPVANAPANVNAQNNAGHGRNHGGQNGGFIGGMATIVGHIVRLPVNVLQTSFGVLGGFLSFSLGAAVSLILPQRIRDAYQQTNIEMDPIRQAREFLLGFEDLYGSNHPEFFENGWKEAAAQAHRDCKFLWVYIHSPDHEDSEGFCRDVLCSAEVIQFLNSKFLCWGGDVRRSQAFSLSSRLGATTFPYMCLLAFSGARLQLVSSAQGKLTASDVVRILEQAVEEQGALMIAEQTERNQRELDRRLREEQDREYRAAQEMDLERDRQRQLQQKEKEEKEALEREAQERERLEKEAVAKRLADQEAAVARRKQEKRNALLEEPAAGAGVSQLRIRLPDGSTHNRRFLYTETVQHVYDFVDSLENLSCLDYTLVTGFPRTFLGPDKMKQDLQSAGLVPGGTLMVQSNDE